MGVLRFAGADAQTFLQGQVSNDTRALAEGMTLRAAYSSPQGRVIAVLELLPHAGGVLALLPRELAAGTRERLRRFVLRAKVQIEDLSESLPISGVHGEATLASWGLPRPERDGGCRLHGEIGVARVRGDPDRFWVIGETGAVVDPAPPATVERDWRLADIRAGIPRVYAETSEAFVAQMLNLDLVEGISFSKGCYTGQEIIARTQHLGRIKRRMFRLRLPDSDWHIGQSLRLADGRSGRITELAQSPGATDGDGDCDGAGNGGIEALAVLNLAASETPAANEPTAGNEAESGEFAATVTTAALLTLPYPVAGAAPQG